MKLQNWTGWTEWQKLSPLEPAQIPSEPGTYMIAADKSLPRAVGVDEEGILDIGKTGHLRKRICRFRACASSPEVTGHMAGWRYAKYQMEKHFPLETLYVSWRVTATEDEAAREEGRLLDLYVIQHMESPPLNYSASWRHLRETVEDLGAL